MEVYPLSQRGSGKNQTFWRSGFGHSPDPAGFRFYNINSRIRYGLSRSSWIPFVNDWITSGFRTCTIWIPLTSFCFRYSYLGHSFCVEPLFQFEDILMHLLQVLGQEVLLQFLQQDRQRLRYIHWGKNCLSSFFNTTLAIINSTLTWRSRGNLCLHR